MSSFLVSKKTINRVVSLIIASNVTFDGMPVTSSSDGQQLGLAFIRLNIDSLKQNYPDTPEMWESYADTYQFIHKALVTRNERIVAIKALSCLIYQSTETNFFTQLDDLHDIRNSIALEIIKSTPQYEKAAWDL